jgi:hypothetical protein
LHGPELDTGYGYFKKPVDEILTSEVWGLENWLDTESVHSETARCKGDEAYALLSVLLDTLSLRLSDMKSTTCP